MKGISIDHLKKDDWEEDKATKRLFVVKNKLRKLFRRGETRLYLDVKGNFWLINNENPVPQKIRNWRFLPIFFL